MVKGFRIKPSEKVWHREQQQEDEFGKKAENQPNKQEYNRSEMTGGARI